MMQCEQHQFKGNKEEWHVRIVLKQDSIFIETVSESTMEHFEADVTLQKMKADKYMTLFFENLSELYLFLESSFPELKIQRGEVSISVDMPLGKVSRKVELKFPTHRKELDESVIRDIRFRKLQGELETLKADNQELKVKVKEGELEMARLRQIFLKFQRTLEQKDEVINSIFVELKDIRTWKEEKEMEEQSKMKRKFFADPTNPHNTKFLQLGNRYKKTGGGSWDLLICQNQIQKNDNFRYTVRQVRAGSGGSFMYGIGTAVIKGISRAQDHKEFIGYYQNTGNIYDRGESRRGGPRVKDGDIIVIEVDTRNWTISWWIEGTKEAEIPINGDLRTKPIYLAFVVYNDEAEIEFI